MDIEQHLGGGAGTAAKPRFWVAIWLPHAATPPQPMLGQSVTWVARSSRLSCVGQEVEYEQHLPRQAAAEDMTRWAY